MPSYRSCTVVAVSGMRTRGIDRIRSASSGSNWNRVAVGHAGGRAKLSFDQGERHEAQTEVKDIGCKAMLGDLLPAVKDSAAHDAVCLACISPQAPEER